ncbi:MAG: site-2 protease family protein [Candidatus Bathyarchaeota archaeon]|nr:site-2 protease family protein [Candidatus Bathyarchaeota archaeon]
MSEAPESMADAQVFQQADFERITQLVSGEFQVQEAVMDQGTPTYYLVWPQETKQAFLRLLKKLEEMQLIAFLRKIDGRIVLRVVPKPPVKPSNPRTNLILLLATVATTFFTGYIGFSETGLNPFLSGAIFSAAILTVLGIHEMGHKLTANKKGIDATAPYFIPGPPMLGTLGAVIMQKSLPPNRDALFDVGANGPIAGFVVALIFSAAGMTLLVPTVMPADGGGLSLIPVSWLLLMPAMSSLNLIPPLTGANNGWALHPLLWAGWAGMVVTMLNLLPAAMLDGGHVARSALVGDRPRLVLTFASVALLLFSGTEFIVMAFLIIFMSMFGHPGPLDDVSSLSRKRKLLTIVLVGCFVLAFPVRV